ncbi:transcriptional regulator, AraC family [Clostridiales bacterium 1_7_47FAA]|uniref:Helix-turn-helix domain-containing protein n=1 Tax=Enterocloster hominis (ex Hitch et al. 2024) TaxID=1917870 RepID=A0ABV1DEJ0_9FIRM|nr:transcriptional regulator, AraC family [Clostridiales bacterium 1_7_47FAA]
MLELQPFIHSKNLILVPYLGNISRRKQFSGWYRGKVVQEDRHEFYLITRGQGTLTVGEQSYSVTEGNLIYIPSVAGTRYNLIPGEGLIDYYSINLRCAMAVHKNEVWLYNENTRYHYQSVPYPENEEWSFERCSGPMDLPVVRAMSNHTLLRELLSRIYHIRTDTDSINFWAEKNILQQFFCEVALQNKKAGQEDMNTRRLNKIIHYIKKYYMEPITLDSLCSTVNLSPSYIIKLFNHYTSLSPMAYVNRVRIEAAREMLAETPLSVSDIAAQTGFKDSFYFSKKFKAVTGITPRQYRNSLP